MRNAMNLKVGDTVRVLPHVRYQHLSKGAVISPPKIHHFNGGQVGIVSSISYYNIEVRFGKHLGDFTDYRCYDESELVKLNLPDSLSSRKKENEND